MQGCNPEQPRGGGQRAGRRVPYATRPWASLPSFKTVLMPSPSPGFALEGLGNTLSFLDEWGLCSLRSLSPGSLNCSHLGWMFRVLLAIYLGYTPPKLYII